jgi:hypothetical protein
MKSKEQIAARIERLRDEQKQAEERHAAYKRERGLGRSNLNKPAIHKREGEISGLTWVLDEHDNSN